MESGVLFLCKDNEVLLNESGEDIVWEVVFCEDDKVVACEADEVIFCREHGDEDKKCYETIWWVWLGFETFGLVVVGVVIGMTWQDVSKGIKGLL